MSFGRRPLGLVLAGGRASRMGGGDKALLPLAGRPILAHLIERLAPQCDGLVLNANGDPARFAAFALPVAADGVPDRPGPLAGMLAGLEWARRERPDVEDLLCAPGDCPFLPPDLAARLDAARRSEGAAVAVAASGGRAHPVVALLPVALAPALRSALEGDGSRAVGPVLAAAGRAVVEWPVEPTDPFLNVNEPVDLARAEGIALSRARGVAPGPW